MSGADDEWMAAYDAWEATRDRMRNEFIEDARARFARDRIVSVESYGDEVRFTSSLTKATRPGVAYQVTDFEGDEPIGHHEYDDLDEALAGLWDLASPRTKGVPPVPNPGHDKVDPKTFGSALKKKMRSKAAYTLLDRHPEIAGSTWAAGGCSVLAAALRKNHPEFALVGVADRHGTLHHVLVEEDGWFYDADGASTEKELLKRWRTIELLDAPRIVLRPEPSDEIPCPVAAVQDLAAFLASIRNPGRKSNPASSKARWWRGGAVPAGRPVWLAASKKYAKFYGADVAQCDVDGKILDLTRLGVDIKVGSLRSIVGDLADTGTSSGEMYEWAEHVWPELRDHGWNGVAVMQWHASFGDDPQLTLLVFDATSVSCGRKRNPSRYRYLGTDDEASDCSCCGKRGLKRVAWLAELDEYGTEIGEAAPYGTTCASMLIQEGHKDPSKKKPTKSQAEKELMQAWRISVQEAWDRAKLLTPPDPTFSKTSFGTAMIYVGDAGQPRTIRSYRGEGEEPNYQPAEYDLVWLNQEWRKRRAIEIGREMGIIEISLGSFGGVKNPSGRLRRTGARISNP